MQKHFILKVLGYGLLFWVIWFVVAIVVAFLTDTSKTYSLIIGNLIMLVVFGILSFLCAKSLNIPSHAKAYGVGLFWAVMIFLLEWFISVGYNTQSSFFTNWSSYLVLIAVLIVPALTLFKPKPLNNLTKSNQQ